jgi:hypothetical protein
MEVVCLLVGYLGRVRVRSAWEDRKTASVDQRLSEIYQPLEELATANGVQRAEGERAQEVRRTTGRRRYSEPSRWRSLVGPRCSAIPKDPELGPEELRP